MDYEPLAVMGVGLLLGSVIRGVTGFGSSIALLSVWVLSRAVGIRACTFQQLVLTDSLSALVASPPLLYVTNARRFTDWRLVVTAVTFQIVGSPIGAYLLLHLDAAHLQLSIAAILTLVFLTMVVTPAQVNTFVRSKMHLFRGSTAQQANSSGYMPLPQGPVRSDMLAKSWSIDQSKHNKEAKRPPIASPAKKSTEQPTVNPMALHKDEGAGTSASSASTLGSLAPQAPPPINIRMPERTTSCQLPPQGQQSTRSVQTSNMSMPRWRSGSLPAASFHSDVVQSRLSAELAGGIPARHTVRQGPPVVRITQQHLDMLRQDVASYHSASPALSWMRRFQPDHNSVVVNYPLESDWDDVEAGTSRTPPPSYTPPVSRPSSPAIDWLAGREGFPEADSSQQT